LVQHLLRTRLLRRFEADAPVLGPFHQGQEPYHIVISKGNIGRFVRNPRFQPPRLLSVARARAGA
jgi:hypothetical protein